MSTKTHNDLSHESLRCRWPTELTKRRLFDRENENRPYIEYLETRRYVGEEDVDEEDDEEEEEEDEDEDGSSVLSEDDESSKASEEEVQEDQDEKVNAGVSTDAGNPISNVRRFMKGMTGDEDSQEYDMVDEVANFCEARFGKVLHRKHVAILDERNRDGTVVDKRGHCRTNMEALTLDQLFDKLSKKRFRLESDSTNAFDDEEIDAERRILFVPDPNPLTIESIVKTAPRTQAPALRELFYKYLTRKTSIGVTIPSNGFKVFTFDFQMPYYVLDESKTLRSCSRRKSNGTPLRQSQKLDFLARSTDAPGGLTHSAEHYWLHEAQTSIVVTGISHWVWTAYGFVDTCFGLKETVDHYNKLIGQSRGRADPLTAGQLDADRPMWTPREYFLRVVLTRTQIILKEWNKIVSTLEKYIERSRVDNLAYNAPKTTAQELKLLIQRNSEIATLLTQLTGSLSESIQAWEKFWGTGINYFLYDGEAPTVSSSLKPSLNSIDEEFSQLRFGLWKLEKFKRELCERREGLNSHVSVEGSATARHLQDLTVVNIIYYPLVITATIFSATGVLPVTPSLLKFIYVLLILVASMMVVLTVLSNWRSWLQQGVDYAQMGIDFYNERLRGREPSSDADILQSWDIEKGPEKVKVV